MRLEIEFIVGALFIKLPTIINRNFQTMKKFILTTIIAITSCLGGFAQNNSMAIAAKDNSQEVEGEKTTIQKFTNVSATYRAWFNSFDAGYYGLRYEGFSKNGILYTLAFKGSWGLTEPGLYQGRVGGGKGFALTDWLACTVPVSFIIGDYVKGSKYNSKTGKPSYDTSGFMFGLVVSPGLRLRFGGFMVGATFDLGMGIAHNVGFYKGFELSLGITL